MPKITANVRYDCYTYNGNELVAVRVYKSAWTLCKYLDRKTKERPNYQFRVLAYTLTDEEAEEEKEEGGATWLYSIRAKH